ncbi:hypothetical protein L218DRAFT_899195 [Marasmius fiardii PR-910]|nr:hypothetical protein L218DRAFT_899195 [Marasmius fiardii PR-910]
MEFKKNVDPVKMNYRKVIWSMHEMMRNDSRRRFVFGLTIENTTVRLWFHNRATLVASDSFDLHRDWQQMVHILVALGTADRKDLGYDDTMSLHDRKERENIFHIQVFDQGRDNEAQPMIFRTIQRITDYTADVLTGRATRVWKVRKVVDGEMVGEDLVLKDTWINDDRQEEHLVLNDIRGQLEAAEDPRLRHFLTCDTAGWVPATKNDPAVKDHTLETHRRRTTFHVSGSLKLAAPSPQAVGTGSQITGVSTGGLPAHPNASVHGEPSFQHPDRMTPLNEDQRIHYRIVFKEVGTPLRLLDTFDHMFFALQGALCGCGAMHEAQYIHRDVSANNILLVERDRSRVLCKCPGPSPDGASEGKELVAVIMDFEYTRNIGSPYGNHHVRTGTWHFMASEVQSQCWTIHDDEYEDIRKVVDVAPWRQHALHDLEALFWVAVWIIFKYLSPSVSPAQFEFNAYRKLFPINHQERLLDPARIHNSIVNGLPEAYHTFSNQYTPWGLFIIRKFKEAFALAYPQMELSVFTASSPAVVTGSMEFLVGLRTIVNTEPKLQGKLEDLKTRQEKELVEEHEKVK